jgi:hypothetical protein
MSGRPFGYCYGAGFVVLMVIVLLVVGIAIGSAAMGDGTIEISYQGFSLSIDVQGARVSEVFQELARRTSYEFIVPEELLGYWVTLKCSGVDLDEAIRRLMSSTGVDNYALVYSPREAEPDEGPRYRVKVMLVGGDFSGVSEISLDRPFSGKAAERAPEVSKGQMPFRSDSFPVAREVSVPQEMGVSRELSMELAPREGESLSEEVPTPAELSSEDEDIPVHRTLKKNQMPIKPGGLAHP